MVVLTFVAVGCRTSTPSPTGSASPTVSATPPSAASATPSEAVLTGVVVDPNLLVHVPTTIAGIPLTPDPETAGQIAADPTLGDTARGLAVARGVSGTNQDDLVIVSVVNLRPGVFTDDFYATWRADYDEAACAPAGGLVESKEQAIGGRMAFVGTCDGGARTYHAHLDDDILVSVLAIGDRGLGELVVAGIR
jgi:hypothetical protein